MNCQLEWSEFISSPKCIRYCHTEIGFNAGITSQNEDVDGSLPNMVNEQVMIIHIQPQMPITPLPAGSNNHLNKHKRTTSNIDI